MSKQDKAEVRKEYDNSSRQEVIARDQQRCVLCFAPAQDIHEIIPRSALGHNKNHILFHPKNRVCLCRKHHNLAHNYEMRCILLRLLKQKYNYDYSEPEFLRYLGEVDGT